jgi:aryl-alcohol dehydrogenase-like predicted oxidoreductase
MEYVLAGRTGLRVSKLCLGTMTFGNEADETASVAIMNRAVDAGINFFDTADIYNKGKTEEIVGRWLGARRESIVLASKVHFPAGDGPNDKGSSRRHIVLGVEKSLKRLQTDWLDIFYLHHWDADTELEESLAALEQLIRQGKILYPAVSNFSAWQTMKALSVAALRNYLPIICVQPMYNLVKRQAEVEILPLAQSERLAVFPYSPIGAGLLTGKYQQGKSGRIASSAMYQERYKDPEYARTCERFVSFAREHGWSPAALAVAWVGSHPGVTAPIVGARNLDQFNDTLQCLEISLTIEQRAEIGALGPEPPLATDRETMAFTMAQVKSGSHTGAVKK